MLKLSLVAFSAILINTVHALDKDDILIQLKEENTDIPVDERQIEEEVTQFQNMDRISQLLEIKRKLMQTLGGINELYKSSGVSSLQVKNEILGILRKVQNVPEDLNEAKSIFRQVSDNLNHLIIMIPKEVSERYGRPPPPRPERPYRPGKPYRPEAEWAPPEWKPPKAPYQPAAIPEWRPPAPEPEYNPPSAEWDHSPYYPPVYPEPEGKLTYLLSYVVGVVRTCKALVLCLL